MNKKDIPEVIPIFPLSNFIIFPNTTVPLNIFEPRYVQMIDHSLQNHRMIGMVQPKKTGDLKKPDLYNVGCIGKISSCNETEDGRYLIVINGINRFIIVDFPLPLCPTKEVIFPPSIFRFILLRVIFLLTFALLS